MSMAIPIALAKLIGKYMLFTIFMAVLRSGTITMIRNISNVCTTRPAISPYAHLLESSAFLYIYPAIIPEIIVVMLHGSVVTPPGSMRNLCIPAISPEAIPTNGPQRIPPDITPIIRVFAMAPLISVPVYVPRIPNEPNMKERRKRSLFLISSFWIRFLNTLILETKKAMRRIYPRLLDRLLRSSIISLSPKRYSGLDSSMESIALNRLSSDMLPGW